MVNRLSDIVRCISLCLMVGSVLVPHQAYADETLRKALAKAQFMLRQANAESTALKQELGTANEKIAELEKTLEKELAKAEKTEGKLKQSLSSWKDSHEELKQTLQETREELFLARSDIQQLDQKLAAQTENFELCYKNNKKLTEINGELLDVYSDKSAWDAITQREPFIQTKKVEIENLVQDYRFQIEDLDLGMNEHMIKPVSQ